MSYKQVIQYTSVPNNATIITEYTLNIPGKIIPATIHAIRVPAKITIGKPISTSANKKYTPAIKMETSRAYIPFKFPSLFSLNFLNIYLILPLILSPKNISRHMPFRINRNIKYSEIIQNIVYNESANSRYIQEEIIASGIYIAIISFYLLYPSFRSFLHLHFTGNTVNRNYQILRFQNLIPYLPHYFKSGRPIILNVRNIFPSIFSNVLSFIIRLGYFKLRVINDKNKAYIVHMCLKKELIHFKIIFQMCYYFLELAPFYSNKYLFSIIFPVNSFPSFHPSSLICSGGITITYLYMVLPLYSRAFCFCSFIKIRIFSLIFICGTTKFIRSKCIIYMARQMRENLSIKEMENIRKTRAVNYLDDGFEPQMLNEKSWIVPSQNGEGTYTVKRCKTHRHWVCSCPDFEHRGVQCKHIFAVKIWSRLKNKFEQLNLKVKQTVHIKDKSEIMECKHCHSTNFIKYGKKNGKQYYKCNNCKRKFTNNIDFENLKYDSKLIAMTLDLYFRGMSLRKISSHLKDFYGLNVTHMTIYNWIEKYITLMNEYVNTLNPDIGDVWHTDEMCVKFNGTWEYLWNTMDEKTRFQLCSVVTKERRTRDARMIFQKAKGNAGNRTPKYLVTDGLHAYKKAVNKEFSTNNKDTEHLWNVGLQHHPNNNHVERLHGTIRDREKVMRGLKIDNTPIVEGHRLYYNFIKPHESLDGRTPSEEAGITIEGSNKWHTLMQKAVQFNKAKSGVIE